MPLPCTLVNICKLWLFYISDCKDKVNLYIHASHKTSLLTLKTWSCEETRTILKDSHKTMLVLILLLVIKVLLKASKCISDGCSETATSQICVFSKCQNSK